MIDVPRLIKDYMQDNCVSQRCLAELLGVSEAAVSRYVKNKRNPSKMVLERLVEMSHLNVSDYTITDVKSLIHRMVHENLKYFTTEDKIELIRIIAQ